MSKRKIRQPRKRNYMAVQELNENEYNWQSKSDGGEYSDQTIIKYASDFANANSSSYSLKSPYHYLYGVYQRYYWKLKNEYQHNFDDYNFIFKNSNLRDKARLIMLHVAMRIEFFSFIDTIVNSKYRKSKSNKTVKFTPIKMASILHDADKSVNGNIVKPHLHFALKLGKQCTPNQLSKWSGIAPQYFESKQGGRYAFDNELAYLTHAKQPQKHLYNHTDVWSNAPIFDYQQYYATHADRWKRYRATATRNELSMSKNLFLQKIASGEITDQMTIRNKHYFELRCSLTKNITDLFNLRERRTAYLLNKELDEGKFSISIIYIYGAGGSGKSQMANTIVKKLQKEHKNWDYYITSSGDNIFDGYRGEPVIYIDEASPSSLDPKAWATLLDPHNIRTLGARYHNKTIAKRVIIMTTTIPPYLFFGYMRGAYNNPEELGQFMRRITRAVRFIHAGSDSSALDGTVAIQRPVKYSQPHEVQVGTDSTTGEPTYRNSRYLMQPEHPAKYDIMTEKQGINKVLDEIDDRNSHRDHSNDPSTLSSAAYEVIRNDKKRDYLEKHGTRDQKIKAYEHEIEYLSSDQPKQDLMRLEKKVRELKSSKDDNE